MLSPILLFVYNRPEHTRATLKALEKNHLASESELFIYSDGAKLPSDQPNVDKVRKVIKENYGFKRKKIIERDRNWGLANNIIAGVSEIIEKYGRVIVFEDDLISSPYSLQYFNDALNFYANTEKVMHISGYVFPAEGREILPETFFYRVVASWGWATWKDSWRYFDADIERLTNGFDKEKMYQFSIEGKENFWKQVNEFKEGKIDSWAIRWYLSVFNQGGLCLYPRESMIQNIGLDGTGRHSGINEMYYVDLATKPATYFPEKIEENKQAFELMKAFSAGRKGNLWQRGKRFLRNKFS